MEFQLKIKTIWNHNLTSLVLNNVLILRNGTVRLELRNCKRQANWKKKENQYKKRICLNSLWMKREDRQ